jgi:hypothetical protein
MYYASAVLSPKGWGPLASVFRAFHKFSDLKWITGWSNLFAQVTGAPSVDYGLLFSKPS